MRQSPTSCQQLQHKDKRISQELLSVAPLYVRAEAASQDQSVSIAFPQTGQAYHISSSLVKQVTDTDLRSS